MIKQGKVLHALYRYQAQGSPGVKVKMEINDIEVLADSLDENFPNGLLAPNGPLAGKQLEVAVIPPTDQHPTVRYEILGWKNQSDSFKSAVMSIVLGCISSGFLREITWEKDLNPLNQNTKFIRERLEKVFNDDFEDSSGIQGDLPL